MRKGLYFLVLAIAAGLSSGSASAAETGYRDILGSWCGDISRYNISRDTLVVIIYSNNTTRNFKIDNFDFGDGLITMNWRTAAGEEVWTKFSEFSPDGLEMVQLQNDAGPRRKFQRC